MKYRSLGSCNKKVGEIGLGCEGFVGKDSQETTQLIRFAHEQGINCIDLYSSDPSVRSNVGIALKGIREQFVIQGHLCSIWRDGQYEASRDLNEVKEAFEDLLCRLDTDYIDVGMIHYVDSASTWQSLFDNGIIQYAQELKRSGKIKHIGMSGHNPEVALTAVKSGIIDVLMFSVNPCYDLLPPDEDCMKLFEDSSYDGAKINMDPLREKLYETCQEIGVGITVMKAFGGGDLLSDQSPAGKALTVNQCIHYALTRPAVASVMIGAKTIEEMTLSLEYENASDDEKDYAEVFASFPKFSWRGHCMYCGHCAPCPVGINVADVTKFLSLTKNGVPETVREHYNALPHHAQECIECGGCELRCPFEVNVRQNMKKAIDIFGK